MNKLIQFKLFSIVLSVLNIIYLLVSVFIVYTYEQHKWSDIALLLVNLNLIHVLYFCRYYKNVKDDIQKISTDIEQL